MGRPDQARNGAHFKKRAKAIKERLAEYGAEVQLGQAYEVQALALGYPTWASVVANMPAAQGSLPPHAAATNDLGPAVRAVMATFAFDETDITTMDKEIDRLALDHATRMMPFDSMPERYFRPDFTEDLEAFSMGIMLTATAFYEKVCRAEFVEAARDLLTPSVTDDLRRMIGAATKGERADFVRKNASTIARLRGSLAAAAASGDEVVVRTIETHCRSDLLHAVNGMIQVLRLVAIDRRAAASPEEAAQPRSDLVTLIVLTMVFRYRPEAAAEYIFAALEH